MKKIFTLLLITFCFNFSQAQLVISEIMYNPPGAEIYEFIEIYNNSDVDVDMTGYTISEVFDYTFPTFTLAAESYVVLAGDSLAMATDLGITAFNWGSGATNNSGENIILSDANGTIVDQVNYEDGNGWPVSADGDGPSLVLCDFNADNNNPANWIAATTGTGFSVEVGNPPILTEIIANPNADSQCPLGALVEIVGNFITIDENAAFVEIDVRIASGNANATSVDLIVTGGTATNGSDYSFGDPTTITFPAGVAIDTQTVTILITDDMDQESMENITFELMNPTNMATILPGGNSYTINIIDNDTQATNALLISGVFDAQPGAAGAKGIEFKALEDIPDLSIFGATSVNNGVGSTGTIETSFPAISLSVGDCFYVADDSTKFADFFGFNANVIGDAANINGDDAIELFENGSIIDVFGDVNVDGSGQPWDYLDGWAYRNDGTGPDGAIFQLSNWNFSGVDALEGAATNADADPAFPTCLYNPMAPTEIVANNDNTTTDQEIAITINVLANDVLPNGVTSLTVLTQPANGTAVANGLDNITYTPNDDFCGDTDLFEYEICDANSCSTASVAVGVLCPTVYTPTDIGALTDGNVGEAVQITGTVYGIDLQGTSDAVQFTVIDNTGGISLFSGPNFGYTVTEGDEVTVQGAIESFNCLLQIGPDTIILNSQNNPLVDPLSVSDLNEDTESELIMLSSWEATAVNGSNVTIEKNGATLVMRIDSDTGLNPEDYNNSVLDIIGIGGQFDTDGTCDSGYQILPRYESDINIVLNTIDASLAQEIEFFPNPVNNIINVKTALDLDEIIISNMIGQQLKVYTSNFNQLDVNDLPQGYYVLTFRTDNRLWATEFAKF